MRASHLLTLTLGAAALLSACGQKSEPAVEPADAPAATATAPAAAPTEAEKQARLASLPEPYNTGDLVNGKRVFAVCKSCHTIAPDGGNMTGPHLHGLFGRKSGSVADFNYSDPMKAAAITWDAAHLDSYLASPKTVVPGTRMTFVGVKAPKDRIDLIAYLKVEGGDAPN